MDPADTMPNPQELPGEVSLRRIISGWCVGAGMLGVIGWFDFITGYETHFFALYLIPVAITAWRISLASGVAMSFFCAAVWLMADLAAGHIYANVLTEYWNTGMELSGCLGIACAIATLRRKFETQKELTSRLDSAFERISRLRQNLLSDSAVNARLFGRSPRP
jgi:hypothetical protein